MPEPNGYEVLQHVTPFLKGRRRCWHKRRSISPWPAIQSRSSSASTEFSRRFSQNEEAAN